MLPLASRILRDAVGIEIIGQSEQEDLTGELSISCNLALSPTLIPLIASQFTENHPNVNLVFREYAGAEVLHSVRDNQVDVGLLFQRQLHDDLEYLRVCPIRVKVAVAATHPLATRPSISLSELADEPAIAPDGPALTAMMAVMREAGVEPNIRWTFASPETIRAMVARGFGYSIVNVTPTAQESGKNPVAYVPISDPLSDNSVVMVIPPGRRRTGKVEKLAEILQGDAVRVLIG